MSGRLVGPHQSVGPRDATEPNLSRVEARPSRPPGADADIVLYKYTRLQGSSTGSAGNAEQHLGWVVLAAQTHRR